jgi:hypothetical protein
MDLVTIERLVMMVVWLFIAVALVVLNRRLDRTQGPFDWGDHFARYGLAGERLVMAGAVFLAAFDVAESYRVPVLLACSLLVTVGMARDLWWPKDKGK